MILVDTSVWIDHFRGVDNAETVHLARLIDDEQDLCICGLILTEVLQGIRSETATFPRRNVVSGLLSLAVSSMLRHLLLINGRP